MSSSNDDHAVSDLIDFDVGSPDIPTSPLYVTVHTEYSDNLLDTELPVLEQKLQITTDSLMIANNSTNNTVDVEDILISLDDVITTSTNIFTQNTLQRCNSEILLDLCHKAEQEKLCRSISCDNLEAMVVLKELDEVLNASLTEYSEDGNIVDETCENGDADIDKYIIYIKECLMELDNYLEKFDVSDDGIKEFQEEGALADTEKAGRRNNVEEESIHIPSTSRGFTNTNSFIIAHRKSPRRSKSANFPRATASLRSTHALLKNHPPKHSTIAVVKPRTRGNTTLQTFRDEAPGNTSSTPEINDANIDFSRLHGVSVATITKQLAIPSLREENSRITLHCVALPAEMEIKDETRSTWLRSSMRRLQHFRLPSTHNEESQVVSTSVSSDSPGEIQDTSQQVSVPVGVSSVSVSSSVRPVSAPSRLSDATRRRENNVESRAVVSNVLSGRQRSNSSSSRSRRHRSLSSSDSSLASSVDSTPTCTPPPTVVRNNQEQLPANNTRRQCDRSRNNEVPDAESPLGQWPHSLSSMLACLSCSLGLFNICRFGILSIHFGANFIIQFYFLSLFIGLPLFSLQLCLGQQLGAGVIDMWRISPLFQGVGVSLLVSQALIGLYSITGVSWMFVYFRDSFITKMDKYRWAEAFNPYRKVTDQFMNISHKLSDTLPDYLSGVVYQRTNLMYGNVYGTIKFQPAFNLAVVWMIVFVSLSKGLRSYGKVVYVFILLPVFATFILCAKLLGMMPPEYVNVIFPQTSWSEFFTNPKSWIAACQEVFLTWGLLGAAVMQIASHNKNKHLLQRDSSLIVIITFSVLTLVAFLANTCVQILYSYGYTYRPNSFEKLSSYTFMRNVNDPLPPSLASTPVRYMVHNSYILGEKVVRPGMDHTSESGYQVLRLATELVPATFALLGSERISPFWAVLFYFIMILFGIAQQLAIWHCVITGIMAIRAKVLKSWETTITFFSCACGFILGLPMTTELGIYFVYFLDVTVGGLWWLILVILLQIIAVFMVRGRPYSGDTVVTALFKPSTYSCLLTWAPALLSFTWNVVLPVVLMVFCVAFFKNGNFKELFIWHHAPSLDYWPLWARQIGSMIQLLPVLCIPLVAVIQSYRYLNNGPSDILERIQLLYRPPLGEHMDDLTVQEVAASATISNNTTATSNIPSEDPPPKYTPPPSYTTATGARIAKLFRQSIRRSVRRIANILGESSNSRQRNQQNNEEVLPVPPPDYNAVLVEMNQSTNINNNDGHIVISVTDSSSSSNSNSNQNNREASSLGVTAGLTASHVANILRNSFRRSTTRAANTLRRSMNDSGNHESLSAENLVDSAAPIGETSLVLDHLANSDELSENKPGNTEFLSVI